MKHLWTKSMVWVLTVAVALTMLSTVAFAAMTVEYSTWADAVEAASEYTDYEVDGDGNVTIYTNLGLAWVANQVNTGADTFTGKTVTLDNNIDLATDMAGNLSWTPIGTYTSSNDTAPFKGTFDGGGYEVSNLYISIIVYSDYYYAGLFGYVEGGTVDNVSVSGSITVSQSGEKCVGGVVGKNNSGTVTNCVSSVAVTISSGSVLNYAGGVVGSNEYGTVKDCSATGNVSVTATGNANENAYAGGVVGDNYGGTVQNCSATGNVSASNGGSYSCAGGVAGYIASGTVSNCYHTTGTVSASGSGSYSYAGGVVGWNDSGTVSNCYHTTGTVSASGSKYSYAGGVAGYNKGTVSNCYATGDVSTSASGSLSLSYAGGVVGNNNGSTATVSNCYATGNVSASGGTTFNCAGGVVGYQSSSDGTVTNCYHTTGTVSASGGDCSYAGGVAGYIRGTVSNCYATGDVSASDGSTNNAGGVVGNNNGTVSDCYWLSTATQTVGGVIQSSQKGIGNADGGNDTTTSFTGTGAVTGTLSDGETTYTDLLSALNGWVDDDCVTYKVWVQNTSTPINSGYPYFASNWAEVVDIVTATNAETTGDYYSDGDNHTIYTALGLAWLANEVNTTSNITSSDTVTLWDDIDLGGYDWTPIGTYGSSFKGTFDGGGHTVSNLYINVSQSSDYYAGLFGCVGTGGTVENVTVGGSITVSLTSSSDNVYAGGVVGQNMGSVTNCSADVAISTSGGTSNYAGGVVGDNTGFGSVTNCYATGAISVSDSYDNGAGGVAGRNNIGGSVTNCYATGDVSASDGTNNMAGGVVGYIEAGTVSDCYWSGTVTEGDTTVTDGIGDGTGTNVVSFTGTGTVTGTLTDGTEYTDLLTALNAWVDSEASRAYCTWAQDGRTPYLSDYWVPVVATIDGADYATIEAALDDANANNSTIVLQEDVTVTATLEITGTVTIDLNGYDIAYTGLSDGRVIKVTSSGALTLVDNDGANKGTRYLTGAGAGASITTEDKSDDSAYIPVTGGVIYGGYMNAGGGGVYVDTGCTFTMEGGTIAGNEADGKSGGGVYVNGTFTMTDGNIVGNEAGYGGGVYVKGDFDMDGGTISNNTAEYGGGVHVISGGTFTMTNGTISENITTNAASGAVHLNGTFNIKGSASVQDVYLKDGKFITFTGAYSGGAIPVATEIAPADGVPVVITSGAMGNATVDNFTSEKSYYTIASNGTEIQLELTLPETYYTVSGTIANGDTINVALVQGTQVIETVSTDSLGAYSFSYVTPGVYNIVATDGTDTVTIAVVVTGEVATANATLSSYSSELVIAGDGTPDVVVGGLDTEATTLSTSITLTVTTTNDEATGASAIEAQATVAEIEYLAIDLTKDLDDSAITSTTTVLEIIVPYDFTGKTNVTVYRYHNGSAEEFTEDTNKADATFTCDTVNNLLYIYTQKFSTYAVGYDVVTSSGGSSSTYSSSVATTENGEVSLSATRSILNNTVTITVEPDEGYEVQSVTVTYGTSRNVSVTDNGDGTYSYAQPGASATVTVVFVSEDEVVEEDESDDFFADVDEDDWFYDAVLWAVENGITSGKSATTFAPYDINTRAEAVTFLYRGMGEPAYQTACDFTDIEGGSFYYDAVLWAVENNITKGTGGTAFSPYVDCTRAQIVTFLWRMAGEPVVDSVNQFTDVDADSDYYNAVLWAVAEGITEGSSDTTFSPDRDCTRAEIVTFLYRYLGGENS